MKAAVDMQGRLEECQNDLLVLLETTTAIGNSLKYGGMSNSQIYWAFQGVINGIDRIIENMDRLVDEASNFTEGGFK